MTTIPITKGHVGSPNIKLANPANNTVTPARVLAAVVCHFGYGPRQLRSHDRHEPLASARNIGQYLSRELTGLCDGDLAAFWNRDRGAIWHAHRSVKDRITVDRKARSEVEALVAKLTHTQP